MKSCGHCNEQKPLTAFTADSRRADGMSFACGDCRKIWWAAWSLKNKAKLQARDNDPVLRARKNELRRERRAAARETYNAQQRAERAANPAQYREYARRSHEKNKDTRYADYLNRYRTDVNFRLAHNLRARLRIALKGGVKQASAVADLGCSVPALKKHLESQFADGMAWDNYGEWHIDHRLPLSMFDLTNPENVKMACNYLNLQPLWRVANQSKGNRLEAQS